ncbi:MAG: hypothetical protein WA581_14090, partial [Candidatus Acidiferrales bacterium]
LVLRFVAHYTLQPNVKRPDEQNLDDFLNDTVEKRSVGWANDVWKDIESAFTRALIAGPRVFGRIAFRKYSQPNEHRRPINRGLFETESVALARRSGEELAILERKSDLVVREFAEKYEKDDDFSNALLYATGRGRASNKRMEVIDRIFNEVIDA